METKSLKFIREYWQLLLVAVGLIIGWTNINNQQAELTTRVTKAETKIEAVDPILLQLQTSMARVETTLEFIKLELSKKQ